MEQVRRFLAAFCEHGPRAFPVAPGPLFFFPWPLVPWYLMADVIPPSRSAGTPGSPVHPFRMFPLVCKSHCSSLPSGDAGWAGAGCPDRGFQVLHPRWFNHGTFQEQAWASTRGWMFAGWAPKHERKGEFPPLAAFLK